MASRAFLVLQWRAWMPGDSMIGGLRLPVRPWVEPVNDGETRNGRIYCPISGSLSFGFGGLLQAAVGRLGGVGGQRTKRSGVAA